MEITYPYHLKFVKTKRILLHFLFWLAVWLITSFIYGYSKYDFHLSLRNNFFYLPVHILYFYTVTYFLIPKYLLEKKYSIFFTLFLFCVLVMPLLTRIVGIYILEPSINEYLRKRGLPLWTMPETVWARFTDAGAYLSALKGTNLVVWFAVVIKFFKLWYDRHHAALQAELGLLKAQIHPHFLFNTLNNLYALTLNNSPKSPAIVMGLSEILRYMLYECNTDFVSLKKDVDILESYIALEKVRYEERLDLNFTKTGALDQYQIAPLLLLPLIENAFKHGAGEKIGQAWINIDLNLRANQLKLKIANGKGNLVLTDQKAQGNIGLDNVKKRLELIYPDAHELKIFNDEDMFVVILELNLSQSEHP